MMGRRLTAPALLVLAALSGCDPQESAWEEAREADTVAAYQTFVEEYPDSPYAEEAERRARDLQRTERWRTTRQADSVEAYRQFLAEFPEAAEAEQASRRLGELEREQEWQRLRDSSDVAGLRDFAERHRGNPLAEQARQRAQELEEARQAEQARQEEERRRAEEATRTHRVQLAALQSEEGARRGVTQLEQQLGDGLGETGLEVKQAGSHYLVVTEALPQDEAQSLCERLKGRNQDCLVVAR